MYNEEDSDHSFSDIDQGAILKYYPRVLEESADEGKGSPYQPLEQSECFDQSELRDLLESGYNTDYLREILQDNE